MVATVTVSGMEDAATTAPATNKAVTQIIGPVLGTPYTRTLKIYKGTAGTWDAVWDGQKEPWLFEPSADLVTHVTKTVFTVATTQAATQAATLPAN